MMGRLKSDQGQLFYEFRLGDAVPEDHLVRKIDAALDLSWLRSELVPHYSTDISQTERDVRLFPESRHEFGHLEQIPVDFTHSLHA